MSETTSQYIKSSNVDKSQNLEKRYIALNPKAKATQKACYELIFMLRHDISEHDALEFCNYIAGIITSHEGILHKSEYWGLRQLAYKINKNTKAHYYFWQIHSNKTLNLELARVFRVSDKSLRHSMIRVDKVLEITSVMLNSLQEDIAKGTTIYDEKYEYKNN